MIPGKVCFVAVSTDGGLSAKASIDAILEADVVICSSAKTPKGLFDNLDDRIDVIHAHDEAYAVAPFYDLACREGLYVTHILSCESREDLLSRVGECEKLGLRTEIILEDCLLAELDYRDLILVDLA